MSYARFSDSDVYVYRSIDGGLVCCACRLGGPQDFDTRTAMIAHMGEHEEAGHDTGAVVERLEEELAEVGDDVSAAIPESPLR